VAAGKPADPIKVTITASGNLDPQARFFTEGDSLKLVYGPEPLSKILADLADRGVRRLMVEGGAQTLHRFLAEDLADELQLAVAPIFVGDPAAPRFTAPPRGRALLAEVRRLGNVALLRYLLTPAAVDRHWLAAAIEEAGRSPRSETAFAVGAVVVGTDGSVLSRGYSREGGDPHVHAEEAALAKVTGDPTGGTIYSSLEPCSVRKSRPRSCATLIREAGLARVVYAWREPALFVDGGGDEELRAAGLEVVELDDLAADARAVNAHLF
jgi:5-amino-6-(5-phosphoribosylamino)uracil reductase